MKKPRKPRTATHRRPNQLLVQFGSKCRVWDGGYPECMLPWNDRCQGNPFICKKLYLKYLASTSKPDLDIIDYFENRRQV